MERIAALDNLEMKGDIGQAIEEHDHCHGEIAAIPPGDNLPEDDGGNSEQEEAVDDGRGNKPDHAREQDRHPAR